MEHIEIVEPKVEYLPQVKLFKLIELAGRVCYKSENKITETSAIKFVKMLCDRGHTSATEHGTVYFTIPDGLFSGPWYDIKYSPFSAVCKYDSDLCFITTNFRVVLNAFNGNFEKAQDFVIKNAVEPTQHELRYTFRIICDRGVSHELVRHRVLSFSQESSRYVNYNDRGFQFVQPSWWSENAQEDFRHTLFISACQNAANSYADLIRFGSTPQQARAVLPNATKTEVIVTGTSSQWDAFLQLRTAPTAHPDMRIIANKIKQSLDILRQQKN